MAWVGVAVGGSALLGMHQANEQQRAQNRYNNAAAESNKYAHITGNRMQQRFGAPSGLTGALKGGLAGFGAARAFLGGGGAEDAASGASGGGGGGIGGPQSLAGASTKTGLGAKDPYTDMLKRGQDPRTRTFFD